MATSTERVRAFRARQRAAIEAPPGVPLRDADELLGPAVDGTLAALKLGERDAAAAQLARRYAAAVDGAKDPAAALRVFGPLLGKALAELHATPASRKGIVKRPEQAGPNRVAQLRAAHMAAKQRHGSRGA